MLENYQHKTSLKCYSDVISN